MSPFSCQAKRDIKYFPSRARQDKSGGSSARERWYRRRKTEREKGKDGEGCRRAQWEGGGIVPCENGKPENDHRDSKSVTTPSYLFFSFYFFIHFFLPRSDPLPPSLDTPAIVCVRARRVISKSPFEILNLDSYAELSAQPVTRSLDTLPATRGLQFCDPAIRFLSQKEDARYHATRILILNVWHYEFVCEIFQVVWKMKKMTKKWTKINSSHNISKQM